MTSRDKGRRTQANECEFEELHLPAYPAYHACLPAYPACMPTRLPALPACLPCIPTMPACSQWAIYMFLWGSWHSLPAYFVPWYTLSYPRMFGNSGDLNTVGE